VRILFTYPAASQGGAIAGARNTFLPGRQRVFPDVDRAAFLHQPLGPQLDAVIGAFRSLLQGRAAQAEKQALGMVGGVRAVELTWGRHGWHVHVHALVLLDGQETTEALAAWIHRWKHHWRSRLVAKGFAPSDSRGLKWEIVRDLGAAEYITKSQEGNNLKVGMELSRSDLKSGRLGSLHPFEILSYFAATGDLAARALWQEYEICTKGRKAITWSRGLRDALQVDEQTDEEIMEEATDGVPVAAFPAETWSRIVALELDDELHNLVEVPREP
jgi:hypothetical protein